MGDFAAWYRRENYDRIREIMDDGDKLPRTFDEWEEKAKRTVAGAAAQGITLEPIILDPEEFTAFCNEKGFPERGSRERAAFAVTRGTAGDPE